MLDTNREYTDAELLTIPPIELEPGTMGSDGIRRDRLLRNPFLPDGRRIEDKRDPRAILANRWSTLNWHRKSDDPDPDETAAILDITDALESELDSIEGKGKKPWYASNEHPAYKDAPGVAFFPRVPSLPSDDPEKRKLEDEWEKGAREMHEKQSGFKIDKDAGPRGIKRVKPGQEDEITKYEDSQESRRLRGLDPKCEDGDRWGDDSPAADKDDGKPGLNRGD